MSSINSINSIDLFLHLEGQKGNNLLVLNISQKNCGQGHDHHYIMYDTFESHFLYQLFFSLKGQQGNNLLVLKISKKRYGQVKLHYFFFNITRSAHHFSGQFFFKMNLIFTFFSYLSFPNLNI